MCFGFNKPLETSAFFRITARQQYNNNHSFTCMKCFSQVSQWLWDFLCGNNEKEPAVTLAGLVQYEVNQSSRYSLCVQSVGLYTPTVRWGMHMYFSDSTHRGCMFILSCVHIHLYHIVTSWGYPIHLLLSCAACATAWLHFTHTHTQKKLPLQTIPSVKSRCGQNLNRCIHSVAFKLPYKCIWCSFYIKRTFMHFFCSSFHQRSVSSVNLKTWVPQSTSKTFIQRSNAKLAVSTLTTINAGRVQHIHWNTFKMCLDTMWHQRRRW